MNMNTYHITSHSVYDELTIPSRFACLLILLLVKFDLDAVDVVVVDVVLYTHAFSY